MPRAARVAAGGMVFHVLNRGLGRRQRFAKDKDDVAFEGLLEETLMSRPMPIWRILPDEEPLAFRVVAPARRRESSGWNLRYERRIA